MILFHIPRVDSGDFRLWHRALLPAYLLRRASLPVKIVAGDPAPRDLDNAQTMLVTGAIGKETERYCRRARDAGLRVLLDIGDLRPLAGDAASLRSAAALTHGLTTASDRLAVMAAKRIGMRPPAATLPSPIAEGVSLRVLMAFPATGLSVLADALAIRTIDLLRRLRRRLLGDRAHSGRGPIIVWFGDAADLSDEGGLGELLLAAAALIDVAEDVPFRLRVVGASRRQFRRTIARLPIATEFRRFTVASLGRDLKGADLCFLPVCGDDPRIGVAQHQGIPVIDSPDGVAGWEARLRTALLDGTAGAGARKKVTASAPTNGAILSSWRTILTEPPVGVPVVAEMPASPQAHILRVVFLVQQFQDLDLICPLAEAALDRADFEVQMVVLTKIAVPASRRLERIRQSAATIRFLRGKDVEAGRIGVLPGSVDVVVSASDGAGAGARHAVAFVRGANALGAATLNLQHGLDNSGLTYGEVNPQKSEQFASRYVLTWGGFDRLTRAASADTRAKVIPVGCPKRQLTRADAPGFPVNGRQIIAVFENLHWLRYDDAYRRRFVADLIATAQAEQDMLFVLKPHMGGRWFTQTQAGQELPSNLVVASPDAPRWRRFTADAFLAHAAAVITTPSTIALDSARYDLPTALVAYGIEAANYVPLPRIERSEDWGGFVSQVRSGTFDKSPVRAFRDVAMLPGDAVARCLTVIRLAGAGRSQSEIIAELDAAPKAG